MQLALAVGFGQDSCLCEPGIQSSTAAVEEARGFHSLFMVFIGLNTLSIDLLFN